MGKQSGHLAVLGLVLIGLNLSLGVVRIDHCNDLENCMRYFESSTCDTDGERQVCLDWVRFTACRTIITSSSDEVEMCRTDRNGFELVDVGRNDQLCTRVNGGEDYSFGIRARSTATGTQNTGSGTMQTINGYSNGQALCTGLESVCAPTGNRDFRLTFKTRPCPTTTTSTTTAPTTTVAPAPTTTPVECRCSEWSQWSTCDKSCIIGGVNGQQTKTRNCTSACIDPALSMTRPCSPIPAGCPVNGVWGQWSQLTTCPVTCGGSTQLRSRECNDPAASNGGQNCPGNSIQGLPCGSGTCPSPSPNPSPNPGPNPRPPRPSNGRRRACRRRCRNQQPRRRCVRRCLGGRG